MERDNVDCLLQLAFLEGTITTRGLYEKALARKMPEVQAPQASRHRLRERLEAGLAATTFLQIGTIPGVAVQNDNLGVTLTVGSFLRQTRSEVILRPQEVASRLGISRNVYRMLEQDRISPLKISAGAWKRFCSLFNVPVEDVIGMIRRTHRLVFYRPSFRMTLARYDARKNRGMKAATLEKAATELYTKARLALPPEEEAKLNSLLNSIAGKP
jgi:DNA-binding XRE family transcriptional regulator